MEKQDERECEYCGKSLEGMSYRAKYCSNSCRVKAHHARNKNMVDALVDDCKAEFGDDWVKDVRKALDIYHDLLNLKFDMLKRHIPKAYEALRVDIAQDVDAEANQPIMTELRKLNRKLDSLPTGGAVGKFTGSLQIPVDDEKLEVSKDEDSGKRANQNFLNSIQAIAGETLTKPAPQGIQQIAIKPAPMPDFDDD